MIDSQILCFDHKQTDVRRGTILRRVADGLLVRVTSYWETAYGLSLLALDVDTAYRRRIACTALDKGKWVVCDDSPVPTVSAPCD